MRLAGWTLLALLAAAAAAEAATGSNSTLGLDGAAAPLQDGEQSLAQTGWVMLADPPAAASAVAAGPLHDRAPVLAATPAPALLVPPPRAVQAVQAGTDARETPGQLPHHAKKSPLREERTAPSHANGTAHTPKLEEMVSRVPVSARSTACMFENTADGSRCGICTSGGCGSYAPFKCYNTNEIAEQMELDSDAACEAYVKASSSVTTRQMQDDETGVPHFGYAAIMAFYSPIGLANTSTSAVSHSTVSGIPGCVKGRTPGICMASIPAILNGSLTGKDLQDCANAYLVQCSEEALETGLCAFLTAGAGTAFCASPAGQAVFSVVNTFANHYFEKSIVKKCDKLEDGAVSAVKHVASWFGSLF